MTSHDLALIRARIDIVDVIGNVVPLSPKGRTFVGRCPFHPARSETLSVNREKGFFYCFDCKARGTPFDFIMMMEGVTFTEAAKRLRVMAGLEQP